MSSSTYNCCITNGLELQSCVNNIPGLDSLYVLTPGTGTTCSLESIAYSATTGEVIGLTASTTGAEFKKIDIVRNSSAALNESTSINLESLGFTYNTQLIFTIPGLNQGATNLYQQIVQNTASIFIVKLKTGKYFLASPSGMFIESATIASGSLPGDSQLYTITLTSNEVISVPQIDVATGQTLTAWLAANSNITLDRE
jgi:hypothetical protein